MTSIEQVKLLAGQLTVFTDDQIQAFLDIEGGDVKLGTALALESLAANQVYVLKVIQELDLKTDGAKVAEALMALAANLRDTAASDDFAGFDVAELTDSSFAYREKIWKDIQGWDDV